MIKQFLVNKLGEIILDNIFNALNTNLLSYKSISDLPPLNKSISITYNEYKKSTQYTKKTLVGQVVQIHGDYILFRHIIYSYKHVNYSMELIKVNDILSWNYFK